MGSTLKGTISLLMNKICILNFLNEFWELFDQGSNNEIYVKGLLFFQSNSNSYYFKIATTNTLEDNFMLFIIADELITEIKNDIVIAERQLEEPVVNKLKNDDFLMINKAYP